MLADHRQVATYLSCRRHSLTTIQILLDEKFRLIWPTTNVSVYINRYLRWWVSLLCLQQNKNTYAEHRYQPITLCTMFLSVSYLGTYHRGAFSTIMLCYLPNLPYIPGNLTSSLCPDLQVRCAYQESPPFREINFPTVSFESSHILPPSNILIPLKQISLSYTEIYCSLNHN